MKKPKLTLEEVIAEIHKRTGLPLTGIREVIRVYSNIADEAISASVECQLLNLGVLSWKTVAPAKRVEFKNYFNSKNGLGDWIVKERADGYNIPSIRFFRSYRQAIKEATLVPYTEGGDDDA